jgi:hypothetical protein
MAAKEMDAWLAKISIGIPIDPTALQGCPDIIKEHLPTKD